MFEDETVNIMINDMKLFTFTKERFHNGPAYYGLREKMWLGLYVCMEIHFESVSSKNKYFLIELASVFSHYLSDFINLIKIKICFLPKTCRVID